MAGYRLPIFIEQDGFIDVRTFLKHAARLDKAAAHEHIAPFIEGFKRNPDLI